MLLVFLSLAWFLGITAVAAWDAPAWMSAAWVVTAAPAILLFRVSRRDVVTLAGCAVCALVGGLWFARWESQPPPPLASHVGNEVTVQGRIDGLPSPGQTSLSYTVRVDRVLREDAWEATSGGIRLTLDQYTRLDAGDRVEVTGMLADPPVFDTFDYRAYLARHGIVGMMLFPRAEFLGHASRWDTGRIVGVTRARLQLGIERTVPEPHASLGSGIFLGLDGGIPDQLEEDFRRSGLAHFVAVSGSNIELVTIIVFFLLTPVVGRRWAVVPAGSMIIVYMLMAGWDPPVVRAGIMATILLAGWVMGRHRSALSALAAAAVVMTILSPAIALDVGFQLSVAATAGLIVFASWFRAGLAVAAAKVRVIGIVPGLVLDVIALSTSATVAVLPIAAVTFDRVSIIGPLANIVVTPIFALAFWTTGAAAILEVTWSPAGHVAGWVAYYPLGLMIWVAEASAGLPGSSAPAPRAGATEAILAYLLMAAAAWPAYRYLPPDTPSPGRSPAAPTVRRVAIGAAAGMLALAVFTWSIAPLRSPGELRIEFLDIGQGDAILVTTPGGQQMLVDGGPSGIELMRSLGAVLAHWDRTVDVVMVTHPEFDHLGGLTELERRYSVGAVYDPGVVGPSRAFEAYDGAFGERERLRQGETFEWDGVTIDVLWPPADLPDAVGSTDLNAISLVTRITYGDVTILLTGDLTAAPQRTLMEMLAVEATVLQVPHHGSRTTAPEFLDAVDADIAVISVGAGNPYGHPHEDILEQLADTRLFRTDEDGRVTITTDGERIRVRTER